nr:MAG: ORF1 protein [Riboviria sp.]
MNTNNLIENYGLGCQSQLNQLFTNSVEDGRISKVDYLRKVLSDIGRKDDTSVSGYESDSDITIYKPLSVDEKNNHVPKLEQHNDILDDNPSSGLTYTSAAIDQFFNAGTVSKDILMGLLNSDSSNVLRHTITNEINNNLKKTISSRKSTGSVTISEILTPEETTHIQLAYSDLDITFTNSSRVSHSYASASRKCERVILKKKLNVDLSNDKSQILLKDIGGNIVKSTMSNEKNIHCCSPVLSSYDGTRLSNRLYEAISFYNAGAFVDNSQYEIIKSFIENANNLKPHKNFCFSKGEECNVKANGLMFLHSNYDIKLQNFADIMENSTAIVAYGSFIFDPRILTDDSGNIPWLGAHFNILRDQLGRRRTIRFGFSDCNGFNYEHDFDTYISYITVSQFLSTRGNSFSLELLENRDGVQFFRVTRLIRTVGKAVAHKIYLTHLKDKYIIRFPFCNYSNARFFKQGDTCRSLFSEWFWNGLPPTTEWVYVPVDKEVIDKTAAFVLGATCEKFKPENITNYLRSVMSREIMYSSIINKKDLPNHYLLSAITHALYIVLYHTKYVYGKVMQQAIANVNATRDNRVPPNYLEEFFPPQPKCCLIRLIEWLFGTSKVNYVFDARMLIIDPPEYLEFVTSLVDEKMKIDKHFVPSVPDVDVIIASELSAAYSSAFASTEIAEEVIPPEDNICDLIKPTLVTEPKQILAIEIFGVEDEEIKSEGKNGRKALDNDVNSVEMVHVKHNECVDPLSSVTVIMESELQHLKVGPIPHFDNFGACLTENSDVIEETVKVTYEDLSGVEMATDALNDIFCPDDDFEILRNVENYKKPFRFDSVDLDAPFSHGSDAARIATSILEEIIDIVVGVELSIPSDQIQQNVEKIHRSSQVDTDKSSESTRGTGVNTNFSQDNTTITSEVTYEKINEITRKEDQKSPELRSKCVPDTKPLTDITEPRNIPPRIDIVYPNYDKYYNVMNNFANMDDIRSFINMPTSTGISRCELKMNEIMHTNKLTFHRLLTLCNISDGFIKSVYRKNTDIECTFHLNNQNSIQLSRNINVIKGDLFEPIFVDICISSGKYDLVVADSNCDSSDPSEILLLLATEIKIAFNVLTRNASLILRMYCDRKYLLLLPSLAERFSSVRLSRLKSSDKSTSEFYAICTGFGGSCDLDNRQLVCDIREDFVNVLKQTEYPRLGILTSESAIDVDGSRNECCFLAACEDRKLDIKKLRETFSKDAIDPELVEELEPGNMAGFEFLSAFSKHFNVAFSVDYVTDIKTINQEVDGTFGRYFRKIYLKLSNYHYYYLNSCEKEEERIHRRYNMFKPFNIQSAISLLRKKMKFDVINKEKLESVKKSGVYLLNNLAKFCTLHDSCKNNYQLDYFGLVNRLNNSKLNISLLIFFETDNFEMDFAESCGHQYPNVCFKPIKICIDGYFAALLYVNDQVKPIKNVLQSFNKHSCINGRYNRDFICACETSTEGIIYSSHSNVNLTVKIGKEVDNLKTKSLLSFKYAIMDTKKICLELTNYFGWSNPVHYHSIGLTTDNPDVREVIEILKNRCDLLYVDMKNRDQYNYVPCVDNKTRIKNMMLETHYLWSCERKHAMNTLCTGYNLHVNNASINDFSTVDTSFVLLDLKTKDFKIGLNVNAPYKWGYSKGNLLNTSKLFRGKNIDHSVAQEFLDKGYAYIAFNSTSRLLNGVELTKKYSTSEVNGLHDFNIVFYQGVPGAGKTQLILSNNTDKRNNLILTVTREAKDDMRKRAVSMGVTLSKDRIRTVDSYLLHGGAGDVEELWVDEALLVHAGCVMWAALVSGCKKLILVGDEAQIPYINRTSECVSFSSVSTLDMQMEYLKTDYRNPLDVVSWLHRSGSYKFDVTGTSKILRSVECRLISGSGELKFEKGVKYLTFTQAEKGQLGPEFSASTIHEYQGNQTDDVVLVRLIHKKADVIYNSTPHMLVALTRHRKSFRYLTVVDDKLVGIVNDIKNYPLSEIKKIKLGRGGKTTVYPDVRINENFNCAARREEYYAVPDMSSTLYMENRELVEILLSNGECGYISWDYGVNRDFDETAEPDKFEYCGLDYTILQEFQDRILPQSSVIFNDHDHQNFEYYAKTYENPGVTTHSTMPCFKKYDYLCPRIRSAIQHPTHDSMKSHLKAFNERNGQVPQLQGIIDAGKEAKILLDKFKLLFSKKCDFKDKPVVPDIRKLESWLDKQPPKVRAMILAEDDFHDQNFSAHDFILKNLAKIDLEIGCQNRYKSPQTIIYQPKTINSVFCPIMRQLLQRVEYCLNPDIIMYNNMSPEEFCQHLKKVFPPTRYRKLNKFLEIDFSKYDKSQGLVLLIFEALLMEYFGVPPVYIKIWIIMHRLSVVHSRLGGFSAFVEYQRKSGDAATWTLNTIIQIAVLNRVFKLYIYVRGGKVVCMFSGDDSLIFYYEEIKDLYTKLCMLQYLYNLEAKLMDYNIPYFCSKFLLIVDEEWIFVPDTLKLIVKLGRKDLVDFEHALCYRISFDDNLYYYKRLANWPYISMAINDRYKINGEHDIVFQALLDISSTDENFCSLYFEPSDYVSRKFVIRPNLEI